MHKLNRRQFVASSAALGATSGLAALPSAAASDHRLDFANPAVVMESLVKLRGSTDGKVGFWWLKGPRYGVVGSEITPLFENLVASFHRFIKQKDGSYLVTVVELSYYVDSNGELLSRWKNPYTGQMNDVEYVVFGPVTARLTPQGITPPEHTPGAELRVKPTLNVVASHAGDVWIAEDVSATIVPKVQGRTLYQGNDLATYCGKYADLADPAKVGVESSIHYQSVTDWRTWMKMGDIKGHLMARSVGRKVWSVGDLPADFMRVANKMHPKLIGDPMAAMEGIQPDSSFQR